MEARQHIFAQVVVVTQQTPAPAYNAVAVSRDHAGKEDNLPVRTGLQRHGRFICLCRLRCCGRLYRPSLAAWSTSIHRAALVCMSCFIEYEQVTAWVARFFFQQNGGRLSYTISRHLHWMVQWAGTQVAATTV